MENIEKRRLEVIMLPTRHDEEMQVPFVSLREDCYGDVDELPSYREDKIDGRDKPQHVYATTTKEDILNGDWKIVNNRKLVVHKRGDFLPTIDKHKKVIASDNPRLKLPKLPQKFLRKFCGRREHIREIDIEYVGKDIASWCGNGDDTYDCLTCKKENFYMEDDCNCVKVFSPKLNSKDEVIVHSTKNNYTRKEVIKLLEEESALSFAHGVKIGNGQKVGRGDYSVTDFIHKNL